MQYSNFNEEKKLWKRGINVVVGLDEAGRGPLAGPVVAAAVFFKKDISPRGINGEISFLKNVRDSKQLSEKKRKEVYEILTNHKHITWGIGIVSEKVIDKTNILQASKLAMQKAVEDLGVSAGFLLIDGNFKLQNIIAEKSIIKGDQKVFSISAASIIAKVTRDNIMEKMHKKYPLYGFNLHKGYGTALHMANLKTFGACKIHRKTFYPVTMLVENI